MKKGSCEFTFKLPGIKGPLTDWNWFVRFSERGLSRLAVHRECAASVDATRSNDARLKRVKKALIAILAGKKSDIAWEDFDLDGAPAFHTAIWKEMRNIPYGRVVSYADVAGAAGSPLAFRACGQACGANRIMIFIPCHRVIASGGGLGGFGCGLEIKKKLLEAEGINWRSMKPLLDADYSSSR